MHALVPWPASMQSASRQGMAYAAGEKAVALHNTAPHSMAQHVQRHLQSTIMLSSQPGKVVVRAGAPDNTVVA